MAIRPPDIDTIADKIRSGKCILFLGAMASAASDDACPFQYKAPPPSGGELSNTLALYPPPPTYPFDDRNNLQRVSLYFEHWKSRRDLIDAIIKEITKPEIVTSPALHMLAALPFRYIITTNYDHLFENALRHAKTLNNEFKDPIVAIYEPDPKAYPEFIADDAEERRPVLLKLHGDIDRRDSIVVTEEDYLTFIQKMGDQHHHPIHMNLRSRIANWPILFIGYSLKDYNLRLLLRTLRWHADLANLPTSYSIDPSPDELIVSVFQGGEKPMMSFLRQSLWEAVPKLYKIFRGSDYQP